MLNDSRPQDFTLGEWDARYPDDFGWDKPSAANLNRISRPEENESCLMRVLGVPDYTPVPRGWDAV